ncbi:MAG: GNAT family acetyltransferase [Pseudomonadota bacterium]
MTRIVLYEDHHFAGVDALWQSVFPDDPPRNNAAQSIPKKLAERDELFFVAEDHEQAVLGTIMAGWDGHRGWLYAVAVRPDLQRSGIGRQLVETAMAALKQRGCNKVNLQIREGNEEVAAFYQSLGFEIEPRTSMGRRL